MNGFLFVGERPSDKAKKMGVSWEDGRLAAKQLFDALDACGIDPKQCRFDNVFVADEDRICPNALRRIRKLSREFKVVAMGAKCQKALSGLQFIPIFHPAARGKIRLKANYIAHVRDALLGGIWPILGGIHDE